MEFTEAYIYHVDTTPVFTCAGLQDVSQEHGSLEISTCTFAAFSRQSTPDKLTLMMVLTLKSLKNVFSVSNDCINRREEHK